MFVINRRDFDMILTYDPVVLFAHGFVGSSGPER